METVASSYLRGGDVESAANLYTSLEHLNPKHSRMARLCRVLAAPNSVPLPHRHNDICEAILCPSVPVDILLGGDEPSTESVQKQFQRLAVHVHPDKNPSAKASEAFLRLTAMKDGALRVLDMRMAKKAEEQCAATVAAAPACKTKRRTKKGTGAASTDPTARGQQQQQKNDVAKIPDLKSLKQTRITLKSLKRKDIDADFEIFSSAHRAQSDIDGIDSDDVDSAVIDQQLAATAPSRFVAPCDVKPPPKKGAGGLPRPAALRKGKIAPAVEQNEDKVVTDSALTAKHLALSETASSSSPPSAPASTPDFTHSESPPHSASCESVGDDDATQTIRGQINRMIADLAEIRVQRTGIRLTCDLSFEAYQREKQSAE